MNFYTLNVFACNREWKNCGKYFPMNATGHVPEYWPRLFDMFGVIRRFSINIWVEVHVFCIDWEKWHGLKCKFFRSAQFFWMFQRWLILKLTWENKNRRQLLSLITYYSGFMSCSISFVLVRYEERKESDKFKMKMNVTSRNQTSMN